MTVSGVTWPSGPPTDALAEMLRTLELTITRKLDGALHGQYEGITPGHGSEIGESRMYQIGDDVRKALIAKFIDAGFLEIVEA